MDAEEVDDAQTLSKFQEGIHKESLAQKGVQLSPSSLDIREGGFRLGQDQPDQIHEEGPQTRSYCFS